MTRLNRWRPAVGACLAAAAVLWLAGACVREKPKSNPAPAQAWMEDMRAQIRAEIRDPEKATKLMAMCDRLQADLVEVDAKVAEHYRALDALDRRHDATREQFQAEMDRFNEMRREHFDRMIGYVREARTITGREDWAKLTDIDRTLFESWQRRYQD